MSAVLMNIDRINEARFDAAPAWPPTRRTQRKKPRISLRDNSSKRSVVRKVRDAQPPMDASGAKALAALWSDHLKAAHGRYVLAQQHRYGALLAPELNHASSQVWQAVLDELAIKTIVQGV